MLAVFFPPRALRLVVVLIVALLSSAVLASEPAFWVVNKGASNVYLLGSMHFGRGDFYPLPNEVETAFARSSRLVVEVDILNLPSDATQIIFKHAGLAGGKTLSEVVSEKTLAELSQQVAKSGVPLSAFQRFQPWYATLMLVDAEIRKTDLQQQMGVDLYFLKRASQVGRPVEELETFDSQLALFSGFSYEEQERFLRQTLQDLSNSRLYLTSMADAWAKGDVAALQETLIDPFRVQPDTKSLFEKMFTQRNARMAAAVEAYLNETGATFFVVGVGHMLGDDGIVSLLRAKGLSVRRAMPASLPLEPVQ